MHRSSKGRRGFRRDGCALVNDLQFAVLQPEVRAICPGQSKIGAGKPASGGPRIWHEN
jgi:hypothetical protein